VTFASKVTSVIPSLSTEESHDHNKEATANNTINRFIDSPRGPQLPMDIREIPIEAMMFEGRRQKGISR
jgi:hypothetical protein